MMILGQSRELIVNINNLQAITLYKMGSTERGIKVEKNFRILAYFGTSDDDCYGIRDYDTEDRAKEIIREIWQKCGEYLHRSGSPAILKGSVDVPEAFWILPKVYEMPEV